MQIKSNLKSCIEIDKNKIGDGKPVFIVVETGVTAYGSLEVAKELIYEAKEAGADAVKFQTIDCEEFMSDKTVNYIYETSEGTKEENMFEMLKKHQFQPYELIELSQYAKKIGITFYLSVDSIRSVEWAEDANVSAYKIGSWDLRNYPLLEAVARTGKPIQIDLGPAIMGEVVQIIEFLEKNGAREVMLVYCSHASSIEKINLKGIPYLKEMLNIPIGYAADTRDIVADTMAIALGANLIEKRLTLDRNIIGHHHIKALDPVEFRKWILSVRQAEKALGEKNLKPSIEDLSMKSLYFTSIVASLDIVEGEIITKNMISAKRPGTGVSPLYADQLIGKRANRDIKKDEVVTWSDWCNFI
jgi:sialic acid synthase SpsE